MQHMQQFIIAIAAVAALTPIASAPLYGQSAQTSAPETPRITVGVRGAWSSSTWIGSESAAPASPDWGSRLSLENAGVSGTLPLTDKLGLRLGGAYVRKGATLDAGFLGLGVNFKLDYIELSALGKASSSTLGRGKGSVYALAGPTLGFKAKCASGLGLLGLDVTFEDTSEEDGITVESSGSDDCGEAFKSTDLGVTGGIGFEWQPGGDPDDEASEVLQMIGDLSGLKVSLELLYTLGLQSIVSEDSGDDLIGDGIKNRAFSIWLGGVLPLNR